MRSFFFVCGCSSLNRTGQRFSFGKMRFIGMNMWNCDETAAYPSPSPKTVISSQFFLPFLAELDHLIFI